MSNGTLCFKPVAVEAVIWIEMTTRSRPAALEPRAGQQMPLHLLQRSCSASAPTRCRRWCCQQTEGTEFSTAETALCTGSSTEQSSPLEVCSSQGPVISPCRVRERRVPSRNAASVHINAGTLYRCGLTPRLLTRSQSLRASLRFGGLDLLS